jgi:hypothetical protein
MAKINPTKIEAPKEVKSGEISWVSRLSKEDIDAYMALGIDPFMEIVALARSQETVTVTNEGVDTPEQPKTPYRALQSLGVQVDNVGNSLQMLADAMAKVGEITQDEAEGLFDVDVEPPAVPRCYSCGKHDKDKPCYDEFCPEAQRVPEPEGLPDNVENIVPEEEICSHAEMANDGIYNCALRADMCPCVAKSSDERCFLNQERGG